MCEKLLNSKYKCTVYLHILLQGIYNLFIKHDLSYTYLLSKKVAIGFRLAVFRFHSKPNNYEANQCIMLTHSIRDTGLSVILQRRKQAGA